MTNTVLISSTEHNKMLNKQIIQSIEIVNMSYVKYERSFHQQFETKLETFKTCCVPK